MMVIFLVGLVSMILMRTLRKDYARYSKDDDLDDMVGFLRNPTLVFFFDTLSFRILCITCVLFKKYLFYQFFSID